MKKNFSKRVFASALVLVLTLSIFSGCMKKEIKEKSKENKSNTAKEEVTEKTEKTEGWWTEDMEKFDEYELKLKVEAEKKNTFINKYGEETYYIALSSCVNFLLLNNNSTVTDNGIEALKKQYDVKFLNLKSTFGEHLIPADYITTGNENKDTIIFVHGQGCNRRTNLGIASLFLEYGYNILTFDLRNSGENQAPFTTFGAWEKYDLQDYVNYIADRVSKPNKIIIWGGSYGGSVVAAGLGLKDINEKVDYAIFDSPVSGMEAMLRDRMTEYVSEAELEDTIKACDLFLKEIIGFSMEDADGTKSIQNTKVPVLIFASKADSTVPFEVSKSLYDAIDSNSKMLHAFKNVGHCMGSTSKPKVYFNTVKDFFSRY